MLGVDWRGGIRGGGCERDLFIIRWWWFCVCEIVERGRLRIELEVDF